MARKASRKMPKRGPSTAARKPAARKPAGKKPARKPAARKPGTGRRKPPTSGYGAAPRSPKKAASQGATNFSPEPNRRGRDASVTPQVIGSRYNAKTRQHDYFVRDTLRPVTTSEHFEYGRRGAPGPNTSEFHRNALRENAAQNRRDRAARSPRSRAGALRRRAR